jgi:hypothetical protein
MNIIVSIVLFFVGLGLVIYSAEKPVKGAVGTSLCFDGQLSRLKKVNNQTFYYIRWEEDTRKIFESFVYFNTYNVCACV